MKKLLTVITLIVLAASAQAATVTVDLKEGTLKSDDKAVSCGKFTRVGDQYLFTMSTNSDNPQKVTVNMTGAEDFAGYDLYVNRKLAGKVRPTVDYTFPGLVCEKRYLDCLAMTLPKMTVLFNKYKDSKDPEELRAQFTLMNMKNTAQGAVTAHRNYRTLYIMLAPADKVVQKSFNVTIPEKDELARKVVAACNTIHKMRCVMYENLKREDLRNEVVRSMTPVEMDAKVSGDTLTVTLKNYCDLPVSGLITPTVAAQPVKAQVTNQLGAKTYTFKVAPGENISAKCVLKVEKEGRIAKITL
ncbi:MAG: hypothetical protein J6X53_01780 [Abditibacteriota bacterium]|nr:hypothetical protein [Abditibacteriota bacterium]